MKVVIEIQKEDYDLLKSLNKDNTYNAILNVTPLPDNANNGDIIKALFDYGSYGTNGDYVHVFGVGGNGVLVFTREWWNAPYKRESEDMYNQ